jgi:hypothetical protein
MVFLSSIMIKKKAVNSLEMPDKGGLTQKLLKFPYGKTFVRNMYYFIEHFWHNQECVQT